MVGGGGTFRQKLPTYSDTDKAVAIRDIDDHAMMVLVQAEIIWEAFQSQLWSLNGGGSGN